MRREPAVFELRFLQVSEPDTRNLLVNPLIERAEQFQALETGSSFRFADGVHESVPSVAAGVYTIWRGDEFLYVGMSGRSLTAADIAAARDAGRQRLGLS